MAARRRRQRRRDFARDRGEHAPPLAQPRHAGEQRPRIGVRRPRIQQAGRRQLHDAAQVHDRHPVGDMPHHAQVVADEQPGQAQLRPQVQEQVQHLRLDRHVERGHRLVQHQHVRPHRQGARHRDPLPLPAAELVREAAAQRRVEPHPLQHRRHIGVGLPPGDDAVRHRALGHRLGHPHARIEAGKRVLVDHLHAGRQLARTAGDGRAVQPHGARGGRIDARGHAPQRALTAPALAHQAQHLPVGQVEADPGHRLHHLRAMAGAEQPGDPVAQPDRAHEPLGHVRDGEQRRHSPTG